MNAIIALPLCFVAATTNLTGRSWRETGTIDQPFAMARVSVASSMRGGGWTLVHDIAESEQSERRLQLWRSAGGGEEAIVMLWAADPFTTGLAWGLSGGGESRESNVESRVSHVGNAGSRMSHVACRETPAGPEPDTRHATSDMPDTRHVTRDMPDTRHATSDMDQQ